MELASNKVPEKEKNCSHVIGHYFLITASTSDG